MPLGELQKGLRVCEGVSLATPRPGSNRTLIPILSLQRVMAQTSRLVRVARPTVPLL